MGRGMRIAFFGSSLTSAYWNGAATYYRGLLHALAERGHRITFYEPNAFDRQAHRDLEDPTWADVVVYAPTDDAVERCLQEAAGADLVVKASGVGVFDELLEAAVLDLQRPRTLVAFWDVDAPATLERVRRDPGDRFAPLIPRYDLVFTYGGGQPVVDAYTSMGARRCVPIYNAADLRTHHPVSPETRFEATLSFVGNRLPDREARVDEFFFGPAAALPEATFLLGGNGWADRQATANVRQLGHVYTRDHNAINASALAVLNISRDSMASVGFSPATRVFEAAAAAGCLITDAWQGIGQFFEPGSEILVASSGEQVTELVAGLSPIEARQIGARAHARVMADHTYRHRAQDVERALGVSVAPPRRRAPAPSELRMVFLGLSITSSWGNGHATTYRGLIRELCARGHEVLFLERDVPWYADNRDLPHPPYGRTELYADLDELRDRFAAEITAADFVLVGSYVPDGIEVGTWVRQVASGVVGFYDIDTPVTLAALDAGTCTYLTPAQIPAYDLYLSFAGGRSLERLERSFGAPRARALYCSVDPQMYRPEPVERRWDLGYLGTYSDDRQPGLDRLLLQPACALEHGSFLVAGAQYPAQVQWPANVDRIDHLPPFEHSLCYNRMRYTLNLTRDAMRRAGHSPSVRLFEASACGVPILSDPWDGLDSLFEPGKEILVVRSPADVTRILQDLPEAERRSIGVRARRRALSEHTAAHRAAQLETHVLAAASNRRNRVASAGRKAVLS